jgi:hypothetical protein
MVIDASVYYRNILSIFLRESQLKNRTKSLLGLKRSLSHLPILLGTRVRNFKHFNGAIESLTFSRKTDFLSFFG